MENFRHIRSAIDVEPLRRQIEENPWIWNQRTNRTGFEGSPFAGTQDAWLRYRDPEELTNGQAFKEPHWSVNYPAWQALPAAQDIVFDLMWWTRSVHLGGVLLTRIPSGGKILPHDDRGSWHAENLNLKIYVPIQANDQCINHCGGESLVIREGQAVSFDNLITHSVENNGPTPRVTLICCFRAS